MNQDKLQYYVAKMISEGLGFDLSDPNLIDTPRRIAKMYSEEFFRNHDKEFTDFQKSPNKYQYDGIIMSDTIFFVSMCSHHFLPFTGHAWLAYIPGDFLVGYSKLARIVEHYAARPQLQEYLGHVVVDHFDECVDPLGAMIVIRGLHGCSRCRGVKQRYGGMVTSNLKGVFQTDVGAKMEVLELIKLAQMDKQG